MSQNSRKPIAIIGSNMQVVDRVWRLGYEPFLVQSPDRLGGVTLPSICTSIVADFENDPCVVAMLVAAHRVRPFAGIVSLNRRGLLLTAELSSLLGLAGLQPEVIRRIENKAHVRNTLGNISSVLHSVGENRDDVINFATKAGWPVIVKPLEASGSEGVVAFENVHDITVEKLPNAPFLIEEYLDGPLFSVEGFSINGEHFVLGINHEILGSNYSDAPYVKMRHELPAQFEPFVLDEIPALHSEILNALEVSNGPTHTEYILTESGPRFLETHCRLGGGNIPEMLQILTGIDLVAATIQWIAGEPIHLPRRPMYTGSAVVGFFDAPPGRLKRILGLESCKALPGVCEVWIRYQVGDIIIPVRSSSSRVGHVMVIGRDINEARSRCDQVLEHVTFIVDPI